MFQANSFLWSHRPDLIFDGSDPSLSFAEFIRSIDVVLDMAHERADDVLPTFLYGDALRFYETLDPECQHNWEKLRDAMCGRFPGEVKAPEAAVRRWLEYLSVGAADDEFRRVASDSRRWTTRGSNVEANTLPNRSRRGTGGKARDECIRRGGRKGSETQGGVVRLALDFSQPRKLVLFSRRNPTSG